VIVSDSKNIILPLQSFREDEEIGEELKLDDEPVIVGVVKEAEAVVEDVGKDENDDVMSKMKKDPDPESYQPIRKRSGPEIQGWEFVIHCFWSSVNDVI
jgi:hypothetical protein